MSNEIRMILAIIYEKYWHQLDSVKKKRNSVPLYLSLMLGGVRLNTWHWNHRKAMTVMRQK